MNALLLCLSSSFSESPTLVFLDKCMGLCFGKVIKVTLILKHFFQSIMMQKIEL